jgi:hypothetical protein
MVRLIGSDLAYAIRPKTIDGSESFGRRCFSPTKCFRRHKVYSTQLIGRQFTGQKVSFHTVIVCRPNVCRRNSFRRKDVEPFRSPESEFESKK